MPGPVSLLEQGATGINCHFDLPMTACPSFQPPYLVGGGSHPDQQVS
jgi:hypothetical protein